MHHFFSPFTRSTNVLYLSQKKKSPSNCIFLQKNLVIWKKCTNFAPQTYAEGVSYAFWRREQDILKCVYWRFVFDQTELRNFRITVRIKVSSRCLWVWQLYPALSFLGRAVCHIGVGFLLFIWLLRQCEGLVWWVINGEAYAFCLYLCLECLMWTHFTINN